MAKTDGQNTAKRRAAGQDQNWNEEGFLIRNVPIKVTTEIIDIVTLPGGDEIVLTLLPNRTTILSIDIYHQALGGGQISVGDAFDAARYKTSFSVASEGTNVDMNYAGVGYVIGTNYTEGPPEVIDNEILATISGGPLTGQLKAVIRHT